MSIADLDKIDAMGISEDEQKLLLLITDHLNWEDVSIHLEILQDKINANVSYLESGQWKQDVPETVSSAVIQVSFLYDIPTECEKFLQAVQDQLGQYGIEIKAVIASESTRQSVTAPKKSYLERLFGKK